MSNVIPCSSEYPKWNRAPAVWSGKTIVSSPMVYCRKSEVNCAIIGMKFRLIRSPHLFLGLALWPVPLLYKCHHVQCIHYQLPHNQSIRGVHGGQ